MSRPGQPQQQRKVRECLLDTRVGSLERAKERDLKRISIQVVDDFLLVPTIQKAGRVEFNRVQLLILQAFFRRFEGKGAFIED
jgi:hypothetical protein